MSHHSDDVDTINQRLKKLLKQINIGGATISYLLLEDYSQVVQQSGDLEVNFCDDWKRSKSIVAEKLKNNAYSKCMNNCINAMKKDKYVRNLLLSHPENISRQVRDACIGIFKVPHDDYKFEDQIVQRKADLTNIEIVIPASLNKIKDALKQDIHSKSALRDLALLLFLQYGISKEDDLPLNISLYRTTCASVMETLQLEGSALFDNHSVIDINKIKTNLKLLIDLEIFKVDNGRTIYRPLRGIETMWAQGMFMEQYVKVLLKENLPSFKVTSNVLLGNPRVYSTHDELRLGSTDEFDIIVQTPQNCYYVECKNHQPGTNLFSDLYETIGRAEYFSKLYRVRFAKVFFVTTANPPEKLYARKDFSGLIIQTFEDIVSGLQSIIKAIK